MKLAGKVQDLLEPEVLERYLDRGYRVIDPHLHTAASCDVIPSDHLSPARLLDHMLSNGWGMVTFTDHDTMNAYRQLPRGVERLARGVEIKIKPTRIGTHTHTHTLHVNVYLLGDEQFEALEAIAQIGDFYGFIDYLKSERLPYVLNHPFWHESSESPNWATVVEILKEGHFPLTEYNWGRTPELNRKVLEVADEFGVPVWGGSDSHLGEPGYATLVRGDTFEEVWENAVAGEARIVRQHRRGSGGEFRKIQDHRSFTECIVDQILGYGEQLRNVTSKALREKPVRLTSAGMWQDLLVRLVTNGSIGRFLPLSRLIGIGSRRLGRRVAPPVARRYVTSQLNEIGAIEMALRSAVRTGRSA